MSATTNLPFDRFVRRASSGGSLSKYGYIGMMRRNADVLKGATWARATCAADAVTLTTNQLSRTDGKFDADKATWTTEPTYTAYMADCYDAFKQAGDAVARNATMCGYAGCVAYRFRVPQSETANAIEGISLIVQRDRYLRAGVRVAACLSDSELPSDDWSVIRGEAAGCVRSSSTAPSEGTVGVESFGFLGQPDTAYLTASVADAGTLTLDTATAFADAASHPYLYVYLTLEDYADRWTLYKAGEARQYYIEGSAMLVASGCAFTFANEPEAGDGDVEFVAAEGFTPGPTMGAYDTATLADCCIAYANGTPWTVKTDDTGLPLREITMHQSPVNYIAAVRQAYAMCHAGEMARPSQFDDPPDETHVSSSLIDAGVPGAAFCVCVDPNLVRAGLPKRAGGVLLSRRVALHRFVLPEGFNAVSARFDWSPVATSGTVRLSAWLKSGTALTWYGSGEIRSMRLCAADAESVGEWRRVASFINGSAYQTPGAKSLTVRLPSALRAGTVATILLTAYAEPDASSFTAGDVIGMVEDANGNNITSTIVAAAGWRPTITLIKS